MVVMITKESSVVDAVICDMNQTLMNESNLSCKNLNEISQNNFIKIETEKKSRLNCNFES